MEIYGYSRVSTDEQGRSGLGLAAQRAAIDDEAARRGWTAEHIVDVGVSGSVPPEHRAALGPLLGTIPQSAVLIVAKLDRLGRSTIDVLRIVSRAESEGWNLVVLDLGLDTTTPMGRFTATIMAAVAQLERDLISTRTRDALAAARRRGQRLGRPVILSDSLRDRILRLRTQGNSLRQIADVLNRDAIPTARGGARWYASTVKGVLDSVAIDRAA